MKGQIMRKTYNKLVRVEPLMAKVTGVLDILYKNMKKRFHLSN